MDKVYKSFSDIIEGWHHIRAKFHYGSNPSISSYSNKKFFDGK